MHGAVSSYLPPKRGGFAIVPQYCSALTLLLSRLCQISYVAWGVFCPLKVGRSLSLKGKPPSHSCCFEYDPLRLSGSPITMTLSFDEAPSSGLSCQLLDAVGTPSANRLRYSSIWGLVGGTINTDEEQAHPYFCWIQFPSSSTCRGLWILIFTVSFVPK